MFKYIIIDDPIIMIDESGIMRPMSSVGSNRQMMSPYEYKVSTRARQRWRCVSEEERGVNRSTYCMRTDYQ